MAADAEVSQRLPLLPCSGNEAPTPEEQDLHKIQLQHLAEAMIKHRHAASTEDKLRAQVLLLLHRVACFSRLVPLIPWCCLFLGTSDC
jgi:hypothetical protein